MTWQEVGDGVFRRRYGSYDVNCGVVLGSGACLLIDTRSHLGEAEELRQDLRRLTRLPITAVVNTHAHFDHCFGNAAFGGVPVWGHRGCRESLVKHGELQREVMARHARDEGLTEFADELWRVPLAPPDRVIEEETAIEVGGRLVRLRHLGRGHTDGDLVTEVPDTDVVFAGDLVEESGPPAMGDAWPLEWPETLRRLTATVSGRVVPGHGDVVDASFVAAQADELAAVAEMARQVVAGELEEEAALTRSPIGPSMTRVALERVRDPSSLPQP